MPESYIKRILSARVYDVAVETPIDEAPRLSKRLVDKCSDWCPETEILIDKVFSLPKRHAGIRRQSVRTHAI